MGGDVFIGCAVKEPWRKRIRNVENVLAKFVMKTKYYPSELVQNTSYGLGNNATQLLNDNNSFEETCIWGENKAELIPRPLVFCADCGSQLSEGTVFCSVCGQKCPDANVDTTSTPNVTSNHQTFSYAQTFNTTNESPLSPAGYFVSRNEFINKYVQPSLRKNITSIAMLCYVCAGLTFIVSCLMNPFGIIEAIVLAGFAVAYSFL